MSMEKNTTEPISRRNAVFTILGTVLASIEKAEAANQNTKLSLTHTFGDGVKLWEVEHNSKKNGELVTFEPGKSTFKLYTRAKEGHQFGFDNNRNKFPGQSVIQCAGPFYSYKNHKIIEGLLIQDGTVIKTHPANRNATALVIFNQGQIQIQILPTSTVSADNLKKKGLDAFQQVPIIVNGKKNSKFLDHTNLDASFDCLRFLIEFKYQNGYTDHGIIDLKGPVTRRDAVNTIEGLNSKYRSVHQALWLDTGSVSGGKIYDGNNGSTLRGRSIGPYKDLGKYQATMIGGVK